MSFKNKVIVVTGAGAGIGAAIAIAFAKEGGDLALIDINEDNLEKVSSDCRKLSNNNPLTIVADISNDNHITRSVSKIIDRYSKIDILINNAGIAGVADIESEDAVEALDKIMNINFRGAVVLTNKVIKYLIETKGNIVNIASIASFCTFPRNFAYNCSKAALEQFSRNIALDLAPKEVRVNVVSPGLVRTNQLSTVMGISQEEANVLYDKNAAQMSPLKDVIEPEEIAGVVCFLASDAAKSVTGSTYIMDGGQSIKSIYSQ